MAGKIAFRTVRDGVYGRVTLRRVKDPWKACEAVARRAVRRYGGEVYGPRLGNELDGWKGCYIGGDLDGAYVLARPFEVTEDRAPWIMEAADRWTSPSDGRPWAPYTLYAGGGFVGRLYWLVRQCVPYSGNLNLPARGYGGPIEFTDYAKAKAFVDQLNKANGF